MNHCPPPCKPGPRRRPRRDAGFTLIEAALTMVIVGVGVLAMVSAQQAYHIKNQWAARTGTAQMLANEIREITLSLPQHDPAVGSTSLGPEANEVLDADNLQTSVVNFDDLDDFAGVVDATGDGSGLSFNPPINGLRLPIADLDQWTQRIKVEKVSPENISATDGLPLRDDSDLMRITVDILYQQGAGKKVETATSMTWIVAP
ncbi:MAG: prepilin-type N-terminal cleavage/methylation domain-containing protein [Planctomycetota bacterium]